MRTSERGPLRGSVSLPAARIWRYASIVNGCWVWSRSRGGGGYGKVRWNHRQWLVHRVAWTLIFGPIPKGKQVLHKCDNPPCFNPTHLFLGTQKENIADMMAKGHGSAAARRSLERCLRGHPYDESNTYWTPDGHRQCRVCRKVRRARA